MVLFNGGEKMLSERQIKLIEILDDAVTDTINAYLTMYPDLRKNSSYFIEAALRVVLEKFTDFSDIDIVAKDYVRQVYLKNIDQLSEEQNDLYSRMMIKISETDLKQDIKLCFRKNEFVYLGDIALCSPALLCKLKDWQREWHIPARKELLKHGLDLCTKLKAWPYIRREMGK